MEFRRSLLEHPESQESEGHSCYLLSFPTSASAADSKQHSLPEMTLRGRPLHYVVSLNLSCLGAPMISARSRSRRPQPCTGRNAVSPAISSTVHRKTASRVLCLPDCT